MPKLKIRYTGNTMETLIINLMFEQPNNSALRRLIVCLLREMELQLAYLTTYNTAIISVFCT